MNRTLNFNLSGAVEGVHYFVADGRVYPIVRGGDGPEDGADASSGDAGLAELIRLVEAAEGDLSALTAEFDDEGVLVGGELFELRQGLVAGYDETRPNVSTRDEVAALQRVQAAIAAVDARVVTVLEEAAEIARELAELDAQVHGEGDGDEGGEGDGSGEGDGDGAAAPAEGAEAQPVGAQAETPPAEDAPADGATQVAASGGPTSPPSLVNLRRTQRPSGGDSPAPTRSPMRRVLAFAGLQGVNGGSPFPSIDALGQELAAVAASVQVANPSGRKHYIGRIPLHVGEGSRIVLASDHDSLDDEGLIDLAVRRRRELREQFATMQASGGPCAPPETDYSIGMVGDRGTPFVESLPSIQSNRGISYFPWLEFDMSDTPLSTGIGFVTQAQDLAGYGGTNPRTGQVTAIPGGGVKFKDSVRIDCPQPVTCGLEMVYKNVVVGRFIAQAFPEYVRVFEEFTGIYFDVARDERAMGKILAAAKVITAGPAVFGASRDLLGRLRQLQAGLRSARHASNLALEVRIPEWAKYQLANDIAYSFTQGVENLRITPDQALGLLGSTEGIMVDTYNVSAGTTTGGSPTVMALPTDGNPLPDFPTEVRVLAWAEGAVFHRSGSEVAFGLQEVGYESNDFSSFMELEENTCVRSGDVYALDVALCDNGAMGAAVVKTCGPQAGSVNEVSWFDPGDSSGGTISVSWDGAGPVEVPYGATASAAKAVLETLPNVNPGDVDVAKVGTRFYVQFTGRYAGTNVPAIVVASTNLTGGAHTATTGTVVTGG